MALYTKPSILEAAVLPAMAMEPKGVDGGLYDHGYGEEAALKSCRQSYLTCYSIFHSMTKIQVGHPFTIPQI